MAKLEASPAQRKFGQDKLDFHSAAPSTGTKRNRGYAQVRLLSGAPLQLPSPTPAVSFMTLVGALVTSAAA